MPFIRRKHVIFFPVETKVRELDFRLILAVLCARPDWQIIVGDHEHLFPLSLRLKNAIIVLKNAIGGKRPWKYRRYKELGHRIIHLDEEAGIFEGDKDFWRNELNRRLDIIQMDADDYVCTWGTFQAEHYKSLSPKNADRIIPTGHPRMELGAPRFRELFRSEAETFRNRYGKFILINTNFISNNARGGDVLLRSYKVDPNDTRLRSHLIEQCSYEIRREGHFLRLINHLSNSLPDHQIVVRPHPSEDIRTHQAFLKFIPRVTVTREGSLHAWLLSASVLIHGGCTTAIEAHLCGTRIINFQPLTDARFDILLPNLLGTSCSSPKAVVDAIHALESSNCPQPLDPQHLAALREILCNFDTAGDSFDRLNKVIGICQDEAKIVSLVGIAPLFMTRRIRDCITRFTRPLRLLRLIFHSRDTGEEKFPPLDQEEVRSKLEIIRQITGKSISLTFHSAKVFSITVD